MTVRLSHLSRSLTLRSLTLFLLLTGVANICPARIGDTLDQTIERYGKPVRKAASNDFVMFKEGSYYVTVHFHDGKTDAMNYVKTGSGTSAKRVFSNDEVEMLLKINGNGQTWKGSPAKAGIQEWKTEDGKFLAVCSESKSLVIKTADYLKRLEEAAKKK